MGRLPRKLSLQLSVDGEQRKLVLRKNTQETFLHIILKVFAYIYFWDHPDIKIEPNYRYRKYKPDLLRLDDPINPKLVEKDIGLWIECKNSKLEKMSKLVTYLPQAEIYWFHRLQVLDRLLSDRTYKRYPKINSIHCIGVEVANDNWFILENSLKQHQSPKWDITREENQIKLQTTEGSIYSEKIIYHKIKHH